MTSWLKDLSFSALIAGFVAVLVGFTSSVALVFQAAQALGASPAQTASWMWALGLGMGLTSLLLSWHARQPVLTAWSTPGAALLAGTSGVLMSDAIGAFLVCGALILLCGVTKVFERVMDRIPVAVASALLAGVLTRFAMDAVLSVKTAPGLVLAMALAFLLARRWLPRYAVPIVLVAGVAVAVGQGRIHLDAVDWAWAHPVWTTPSFHVGSAGGRGPAAVPGHHGVAECAGRSGAARFGLPDACVDQHQRDRLCDARAGAVRCLCAQPGGHHRGHLHGPRGA